VITMIQKVGLFQWPTFKSISSEQTAWLVTSLLLANVSVDLFSLSGR